MEYVSNICLMQNGLLLQPSFIASEFQQKKNGSDLIYTHKKRSKWPRTLSGSQLSCELHKPEAISEGRQEQMYVSITPCKNFAILKRIALKNNFN